MAKIYEVLIKNASFDRMHILAEDAENAKEIAEELISNNAGECEFNYDIGYREVEEANEVPTDALDAKDKEQAETNNAEYREITS